MTRYAGPIQPGGSGEALQRGFGAIGWSIGAFAALAPRAFLRVYGMRDRDITGTAEFGWRLFGVRNLVISTAALRGDASARAAFLPVQIADQAVFAHALVTGSVPRRSALLAMGTSGAIIALDVAARRAGALGEEPGAGH